MRGGIVFTILQTSLMPGLIEGSWIVISAFAFSLVQYGILAEVYGEYLASHRYV